MGVFVIPRTQLIHACFPPGIPSLINIFTYKITNNLSRTIQISFPRNIPDVPIQKGISPLSELPTNFIKQTLILHIYKCPQSVPSMFQMLINLILIKLPYEEGYLHFINEETKTHRN